MKNTFISLLTLGILLIGCRAESTPVKATVSGTVTYLQRIALLEDAVVTVRIQDISLADAPAVVLGEQVIKPAGKQVPIPFEVEYNPEDVKPAGRYAISARIEDANGKLLFITDTVTPVFTSDAKSTGIELILKMVQ
jgi:putative lipoprotein